MNIANSKAKVAHEMQEYLVVFLLLAPFFIAFVTHRIFLIGRSGNEFFAYGTALINALVLAKIILIGELARLGKRSESGPLIVSTVYKSVLFTMLYLAFHIVEGTLHGLWHGQIFLSAIYEAAVTRRGELVAVGLVMFFAFIPFFALREVRRVVGENKFRDLFFRKGQRPRSEELKRHAVAG
jgi:hypothetical protein